MNTAASPLTSAVHDAPSTSIAPLVSALEPSFLELISWSWQRRIVSFPAEHPLLGWKRCRVSDCDKAAGTRSRLCTTCHRRWLVSGIADLETYVTGATRPARRVGVVDCAVPGCERPAIGELCEVHRTRWWNTNDTLEQFIQDPQVGPLKHRGICSVASCPRDRSGPELCSAHRQKRRIAVQRDPVGFDEQRWLRTTPAIVEDNKVSLLGLGDPLVVELLLGLQHRTARGRKSQVSTFRSLTGSLRRCEAETARALRLDEPLRHVLDMHGALIDTLDRYETGPLRDWSADRWALESVGHAGAIDFTSITQAWLREATKRWAFDELPRHRGPNVAASVRRGIAAIDQFSASLTRHRHDHGNDPRALSRGDVIDLLNWLAHLEHAEQMGRVTRRRRCHDLARILTRMRTMGLAKAGEPLAGLPDDVFVDRAEIPAITDNDAGRDLPSDVASALIAQLPALGDPDNDVRVAVELIIDTGRRPSEIVALPLNCLAHDGDGKPVLIWDNLKAGRLGRRLPITGATAQAIMDQQERVRDRFPMTAGDKLPLLPAGKRNHVGTRPIGAAWLWEKHRDWVAAVPDLTTAVTVDEGEHTVVRQRPFPAKGITLYSWRHTYCQRHADAGIAPDVLRDLMDHGSMQTTQAYYRVSELRRRDAIDRVTTMQFDRHGERVWRRAEILLDSERARRSIGEVAVPYGLCTEPSNVAAGGGDCPVRFRCVGCNHFRTDVSYLPDIEGYLADLLRHRERLRAAVDVADAWAITEASPSDEEITRLRTLIRRIKHDVDDLDPDTHHQIQAAVTAVRSSRNGTVGLGMPRVRSEPLDLRKEPTA